MEHEVNPSCDLRFKYIEDRIDHLDKTVNGNGKTGLKQDVADVKRDIEDVCKSNDRIETQLEEFIAEYRAAQVVKTEGDKTRKNEILKIITTNGFQFFQAVVGAVILYFIWRLTGQIP